MLKIWWKLVEQFGRYCKHQYVGGRHFGRHFVFCHIEIITDSYKLESNFKIFGENLMKIGWTVVRDIVNSNMQVDAILNVILYSTILKLWQIPISWKYISKFLVKIWWKSVGEIWWKSVEWLKRYSRHKYLGERHYGCHFVFHHVEIITDSSKWKIYFKIFGENLMKINWITVENI